MEGLRKCMNAACGAALAIGERRKGWGLKSGGFAELCNSCGAAFERLDFCDIYHSNETGWRECSCCGQRLHCGCIVSKLSMELLDSGGVQCINCTKVVEHSLISTEYLRQRNSRSPIEENATTLPISKEANTFQLQSTAADGNICDDFISKIISMNRSTKVNGQNSSNGSVSHVEPELVMLSVGNPGPSCFPNINQALQGLSGDRNKYIADDLMSKKPPQTSLISLGTSNQQHSGGAFYKSGRFHPPVPISNTVAEGKELNKMPPVQQQTPRARHLLPKPPKVNHSSGSEAANDMLSHLRAVRPPVEGRGRTQLLPRYWPRITEEELQKMIGESPNSTIVPLFEKVLSASDAGRIGRLVLPKACAEAYFPHISQPEGLPLTIQDVKGKNWVFQFRFWPNNNSRMYVLEGVTPCIQSLQLQAGDTVTFSRIDPEGKLIMGFRKATNSVPLQDSQISAIANGLSGNESILSGVSENLPIVSGYLGLHQSLKESPDSQSNDFFEMGQKPNKHGSSSMEELQKRCGYGGSKSKRLHIDHEDAMELKLTWEEAQDLLRPPLSSKPSIVMIEDHEFEEYDEPPVLGKRTIFTVQTAGIYDQWAQCDNCFKWRRLPVEVLLTSKWTCAENKWDLKRSSCSAPTEISPTDLQNLVQQNADLRRRKLTEKSYPPQQESSGLDALATVAALGDDTSPSSPVAKTTKHPRHRPGCTCIVCIQPPSGKGPKHKPDCVCNVCMTVRRRFNTLMMRKKKKQTEQEEAASHRSLAWVNNDEAAEATELPKVMSSEAHSESNSGYDKTTSEELVKSNEHLNVNFHPMQENNLVGLSYAIMSSHLEESDHALQSFRRMDVSANLSEQVVSSSSTPLQVPANKEGFTLEPNFLAMRQDQGSSPEGVTPSNMP